MVSLLRIGNSLHNSTFNAWEIVLPFMSEVMTLEFLLVSPVLSLLGFRKELLDPVHGGFSTSSGIVLYQLTHPWGVPVPCTQAISVSSRGQQTGHIS